MKNISLLSPGMKVAVLGLGVSGRAAVCYARHCGAEVLVSDIRSEQRFVAEEGAFLTETKVEWEAGGHSREFLNRAQLLLVSPGVDLALPLFKALQEDGVQIVGEFAIAAGLIKVPVVAITGTNGKTTVTTLIGDIFATAGNRVFVGGNIGTPLYEYLLHPEEYDIVVAEVSSFQLETAGNFAPDVGVLLNITPDHLDRHGSMERYAEAKMQLFIHQHLKSVTVINGDDPLCRKLVPGLPSIIRTFGVGHASSAVVGDHTITLKIDGLQEDYEFDTKVRLNTITLMNYAAAILATRALACTQGQIVAALRAFRPLQHRIEFVAEMGGVRYYNDSKATNTGAVIGALAQFSGNVILIAGGRDKNDDFRLLRKSVAAKVKKLVLIGEAAGLLEEALADLVPILAVQSMDQAVQAAAQHATAGDVVLLSPACASFDMFTSYGHRGSEFKKAVLALGPIPA